MHWIHYLILIALLLFGWFINILGLPGLWLMVAAHALYGLITGWKHYIGWESLIALIALAIAAEIVEFMAGAAGSKSAGGRKRGMFGAIVGGLVGGLFFTGLVPIPIVGTIIGVCLGTFIGAAIAEYYGRGAVHSVRVGIGAAKGRFWGIISKSAFGLVMFGVSLITALPYGTSPIGAAAPAPATPLPPTTSPSSSPATTPTTFPATP